MKRVFFIICLIFLLGASVVILAIKGKELQKGIDGNKIELVLFDELSNSILQGYLLDLQMLVSDTLIIDGVLKNNREQMETRIDALMSFFYECDLLLLSNIKGEIIASNTTNNSFRSFNNDAVVGKTVEIFEWHKKDMSNLPKILNRFEFISEAMALNLLKISKSKKYLELLVSVMDVTGSRIGVVTAYYTLSKIENIARNYRVQLSDNFNNKINNKKNITGTFFIYDLFSIGVTSYKKASLIQGLTYFKQKNINLFSYSLYEFTWFMFLLFSIILASVVFFKKYGKFLQDLTINNNELYKYRVYKGILENYGITIVDEKNIDTNVKKNCFIKTAGNKEIVLNKDLVDEIIEPVQSSVDFIKNENIELKNELLKYNKLDDEHKNLIEKTKKLNENMESIYITIGSLMKYLSKVEKRKEINMPDENNESTQFMEIKKLEDVVLKRDRIICTLKDLAEESAMLLNYVYPLCSNKISEEFNDLFEVLKRKLRFLILNIGALEGFFNEINIDSITETLKENISLKKDHHKLLFLIEKNKLIEADLIFYKKALTNTVTSLKEIEQGVIKDSFTDYSM